MSKAKPPDQSSGCRNLVVWFVMPLLSVVIVIAGLFDGATMTFDCTRTQERETREEIETHGDITRPVERVVQEGRVDVIVTRRILGVIPIQRVRLEDVVDADSFTSTNHLNITSTSRVTRSYDSGNVSLATRDGKKWESPSIARAFGASPAEIRERIESFVTAAEPDTLKVRVVPWFSNVIAVPFVFVALMFVRLWGRRIVATMRGQPPPQI